MKKEAREYLLRDAENMRAFSFSENYIKETLQNTEKWYNTGLLYGLDDTFVGRQVARLLENQRQMNEEGRESYKIPENVHSDWNPAQWRRVSIPAIRRVFGAFLPYKLVSVQAIARPEDRFYYTGLDERQNSLLMQAKTRHVGRDWWHQAGGSECTTEGGQHSLDKEATALAAFAQRYANDATREVIRDLTNNAGSKANAQFVDENQLLTLVEGMSAYIAAKIKGREATWIVASPTVCELLKPFVKEWNEEECPVEDAAGAEMWRQAESYRGKVNDKWALYESPLQPEGKILMGHKDARNHYFSGYFYCPFHPFTQQPSWWKDDGTHEHNVLYSRYGKKLIDANFYGLIDVADLPSPKTEQAPAEEKAESEA